MKSKLIINPKAGNGLGIFYIPIIKKKIKDWQLDIYKTKSRGDAIKEAEKTDKKKDQTPANKTSDSQQNKTQSDTGTGVTTNDLDLTMVFGALIIILIVLFFLSKFFGSKNEQKD